MSDLVGNPEDRFSHNEAHIVMPGGIIFCLKEWSAWIPDVQAEMRLYKGYNVGWFKWSFCFRIFEIISFLLLLYLS